MLSIPRTTISEADKVCVSFPEPPKRYWQLWILMFRTSKGFMSFWWNHVIPYLPTCPRPHHSSPTCWQRHSRRPIHNLQITLAMDEHEDYVVHITKSFFKETVCQIKPITSDQAKSFRTIVLSPQVISKHIVSNWFKLSLTRSHLVWQIASNNFTGSTANVSAQSIIYNY